MFRSTAVAAALFAALPGCASVADMRQAAPRAEYTTAKPAGAVEQCLVGAFGWLSAPTVIRSGPSTEVVFGPFNNAVRTPDLVDVEEASCDRQDDGDDRQDDNEEYGAHGFSPAVRGCAVSTTRLR
jgi:hypothetical protein